MESSTITSAFSSSGASKLDTAAADNRPARLPRQISRGRIKAIRLARRENQQGVAPLPLHDVVGRQHSFLFLGNHAAGNQNRPALLPPNLLLEPTPNGLTSGGFAVVFQVADHFDAIFRRAHFASRAASSGVCARKSSRILQDP